MIKIEGWIGTTLIDFPGKVAAEVFVGGCNFRCPFCHNSSLVFHKYPVISMDEIKQRIEERRDFIDGVVISGGEPTMYGYELIEFVEYLKSLNLLVKIDTNGSFSKIISKLIKDKLVDFISMDIKSSRNKYGIAVNLRNVNIAEIDKTINLIKNSDVEYEFRTTVVPGIVDKEDISDIGEWIKGASLYVLQQFKPQNLIDKSFFYITPYPLSFLEELKEMVKPKVKEVKIRNQ